MFAPRLFPRKGNGCQDVRVGYPFKPTIR